MKSFSLLRTNTGLTTNLKIMVDSNYGLFLESIESDPKLSSSRYKNVPFIKTNFYDELIPFFYQNSGPTPGSGAVPGTSISVLPADTAFSIKYDSDNNNMSSDFSNQYDDIYQMGARNISDNKNYSEEFECFAPLYIDKSSLPKGFVILRVDGPGLLSLTKDNFRSEILEQFKCVRVIDLTKKTPIGEWLDTNFTSNVSFPPTPFEIDFRRLEFSKWNGINYESGGYTYMSFFLDETLEKENPLLDMDKSIFDGYKKNKIVFPNILNLSFLFNDTPATPLDLRKWSINRYYGFYFDDIELYDSITPNLLPKLKDDISILPGNIISSLSGGSPFIEPWKDSLAYYIEYNGNFYKVEQFTAIQPTAILPNRRGISRITVEEPVQLEVIQYRIISDIDLTGKENELDQKIIFIDENNAIVNIDLTYYQIPDFNTADIWLISINDVYHNLISEDGKIIINSDYAFNVTSENYRYWINQSDPSYTTTVSLIVGSNSTPTNFNIYKLNLTDIKDFDNCIIDTEYSKFEYENKEDITITDETKMYTTDYRSTNDPLDLNDYNFKNKVVNIPTSSEYTANYETFRIEYNDLTDLWRKNSTYCRWSYQDSLSANDYPYLLNNSTLFEDYNRTANTFDPDPKRIERNLDYFYSINSATTSYVHHTLHVENNTGGIQDTNFNFEIDKYLNLATCSTGTYSYDYFSYFFSIDSTFDNGNIIKSSRKYSLLSTGDNVVPNTTVFRGIKFRAYDVDTIKIDQGVIDNINLKNSNSFENYKFSILLSDNNYNVTDAGGITPSNNNMQWSIIENWEMDKNYSVGSIVLLDDILFQSVNNTITTAPARYIANIQVKSAPYNDPDWITFTYSNGAVNAGTSSGSPFWNPNYDASYNGGGLMNDIVYNNGEYYECTNPGSSQSFWNPNLSYSIGQTVLFQNQYYTSNVNGNIFPPNASINVMINGNWTSYWSLDIPTSNPKWVPINLWNPSLSYTNVYVANNNIIYYGSGTTGDEPGITSGWNRVYSINQDPSYVYTPTSNPFVEINNKIYLIQSNSTNSTLENGINIYINKKWKNILVNIYINDNTITNLSGVNRDDLYTDLNKKLTAINFIYCLNDVADTYGFSDYLNYIIIDEDNTITKYNSLNNISSLPSIILCEAPDELLTKVKSLIYTPVTLGKNVIKSSSALKNGNIADISQLNYYNDDIPFGADISYNINDIEIVPNYHGIKNTVNNSIFRHSGYYMPLFYTIELFGGPGITASSGNYLFNTSYTNFGTIKQRVISKVNRKGNILKLNNNTSYKSIYPMLDEFGYTFTDFFMFKSTWDYQYHIECSPLDQVKTKVLNTNLLTTSIPQLVNTNTNINLSL